MKTKASKVIQKLEEAGVSAQKTIDAIEEAKMKRDDKGSASNYNKYRNGLMRKFGYKNFGQAMKDEKFVKALDAGWNAGDEKGADGKVNEAKLGYGDLHERFVPGMTMKSMMTKLSKQLSEAELDELRAILPAFEMDYLMEMMKSDKEVSEVEANRFGIGMNSLKSLYKMMRVLNELKTNYGGDDGSN